MEWELLQGSGKDDLELCARPCAAGVARHVAMLRSQGFIAAVSAAHGAARARTDLFCLPRFTPPDRAGSRVLLRMAS